MDREEYSSFSRRSFLRSIGGPAGLYSTGLWDVFEGTTRNGTEPAHVNVNDVIGAFVDNVFEEILRELSDVALEAIGAIVDRIGRAVDSAVAHVGTLVDDVLWIMDNAGALWDAVQDAIDAAESDDDEDKSLGHLKRQYAQDRGYQRGAKMAELGWPEVDVDFDVDVPDLPDISSLGEEVVDELSGVYDQFVDRFGYVPGVDEIMGWIEEAYATVVDWFMELLPDVEIPDDPEAFGEMFPLSYDVDFDTFDFGDFFDIDGISTIELPWSVPEDGFETWNSAAAVGRSTAPSGVAPTGPTGGKGAVGRGPNSSPSKHAVTGGAGVDAVRQDDEEILDELAAEHPSIELKDCANVPGPVKALPMTFDWAEGIEGDIPGPCGNEAAPSAEVWVGWHEATPPCIYTAYDASMGCSITVRDVAEYAAEYEEELEALSEAYLSRLATVVDDLNALTEQPEVVIDEAIDGVDEVEDVVEAIDGYVEEENVPVDPLGIEGKIDRLLEDDGLSTVAGDLGHSEKPVGGLERLKLVLGEIREELEAFDPDLPHDRVEAFADELEGADVDYPISELRELRDEIDERVAESAERDGVMQFDLADAIDEDTRRIAQMLYELAREHEAFEENTPFTSEDIERVAETYEAFTPVEVDVSDELEAIYQRVVDRVISELESILNQYASWEHDFTDPFPEIRCRRFCSASRQPRPVPAPDAEAIAAEAARKAMENAREPAGSGDGSGGFFEAIAELPSIIMWIIGVAIILLVLIAVAVYEFGLGVGTVGTGGTASPVTVPAMVLGIVFLGATIEFVRRELWDEEPAADDGDML